MPERDMSKNLIDMVPDYKIGYVLAYLQGLIADEEADDAFCKQLWEEYKADPDPDKDRSYSLEELKLEYGIV